MGQLLLKFKGDRRARAEEQALRFSQGRVACTSSLGISPFFFLLFSFVLLAIGPAVWWVEKMLEMRRWAVRESSTKVEAKL